MKFAPPRDVGRWDGQSIKDTAVAFLEAKSAVFTKALATGVTDDDALLGYLRVAIKNYMADEAKKTNVGKLRRRLKTVLGSDKRFVASGPGDFWSLRGDTGQVWSGDPLALRSAAAAVRGVYIAKLNSSGPTPRAVADVLRTVAAAVLTAADGAVPAQDLARVLWERCFGSPTTVVNHDRLEHAEFPDGDFSLEQAGPGFEILIESAARSVFDRLTVRERAVVLRFADGPNGEVEHRADVGTREDSALLASALAKLRAAVEDDSDQHAVLRALLHLCREERS